MNVCKILGCNKPKHAHGMCNAHVLKKYRKENPNKDKEYEKTPKGFLMRLYRNMQSRIEGIQKKSFHLYKNKTILPRKMFYDWALNHPKFWELFNVYKSLNYQMKIAPSVDRINPDLGYELNNMEWVTQSENSRRASVTRKRLVK